jgi:hypothetical protein
MRLRASIRVAALLSGTVLTFLACGGGSATRRRASPAAGPTPEVVWRLQMPASPYYIIYSPPVSLAKQPDTTAHGRKPRS